MPLSVDVRPGEQAAWSRSLSLDGVAIRLRGRWLPWIGRWLVRVETPDGAPLTSEQIVSPGGQIVWDRLRPDTPSGVLLWTGPDPYDRDDLGVAVGLLYVTAAELAVAQRPTFRQLTIALTPPGVKFDSTLVTWDSTAFTFDAVAG
jgi:hypothetical protein